MATRNSTVRQHLAETVVVKETQLSANVSGVVPVMSSHCAGDVPPASTTTLNYYRNPARSFFILVQDSSLL